MKCLEEDTNDSKKSDGLEDNNESGLNDRNNLKQKTKSGHFVNITSLKQHYSKVMVVFLITLQTNQYILCNFLNHFSIFCIQTIFQVHAHRGISCNICKSKSAVFATASQLEKHKTSLCGKKFICTTCKRQYGGLEHLQVRIKLFFRFYYFYQSLRLETHLHNHANTFFHRLIADGKATSFQLICLITSKTKEAPYTKILKR